MEFSFDRAKNAHLNRTQSTNSSVKDSPSAGLKAGPDINSQDPSTIANERLRKAIERNRAKQAERDAQKPKAAPSESTPSGQASFFSQQEGARALPKEEVQQVVQKDMQEEPPVLPRTSPAFTAPPPRQPEEMATHSRPSYGAFQTKNEKTESAEEVEQPQRMASASPAAEVEVEEEEATVSPRAQRASSFSSGAAPRRESVRARTRSTLNTAGMEDAPNVTTDLVSRRSVAKPEDTEFVPVKRASRKVTNHVSYTTSSTRKKATKTQDESKYVTWLVKGCWMFCGLMVLRLIFANGGVTDFYSQKQTINSKLGELSEIKKENMNLVREIEKMRTDSGYQKKLVRDNLGFIAPDEFLILFPREQ